MKIVQVVNAMISQKARISDVAKNGTEYFFIFNGEYKWSMSKNDEEYFLLHFYPSKQLTIKNLVEFSGDWSVIDFATYSDKDIKTREASESFAELYQILMEKLFDLDKIFEDILNTDLF